MKQPPNILLIFTDQHQQKILGAYGNRIVKSPRLDALAEEGVLFHNAIVAQPVCTPSRASLLTGTYVHTHQCLKNGATLTTEIPTAAEILRRHGYRCGYLGKWHLGNETVPQRGFEEFYCVTDDHRAAPSLREQGYYSAYYHFLKEHGHDPKGDQSFFTERDACDMPEEFCRPAFFALKADEFFRTRKDAPFFLTVSISEPHPPYFGPFDQMYSKVPVPGNYHVDEKEKAGWSRRNERFHRFYFEKGHNICTGDLDDLLENTARYYGLVTLVDKYVGKILDSLEAHGLAQDTIVLFTSDHGDMLGSHQMVDKGLMFEESIKVPFILKNPRESWSVRETRQMINNVDVLPTLLDMAGLPVPAHIQGNSILPALRGEANTLPNYGVVEWNGVLQNMHRREPIFSDVLGLHVRCIVTDRWKLVLSPGDRSELYDLHSDPLEQRNVFEVASNREILRQLYEHLIEWQRKTNDPLEVPPPHQETLGQKR